MHFRTKREEVERSVEGLFNKKTPHLGNCDGYKLCYAIDEAAEEFSRTPHSTGIYTCKGERVRFINENRLTNSMPLLGLGRTKIPGVYYLADSPQLKKNAHAVEMPEHERTHYTDPAA